MKGNDMPLYGVKWVFFDLGYTLINEDEAHKQRILLAHLAFLEKGQNTSEKLIYDTLLKVAAKLGSSHFKEAIQMLSTSEEISDYVLKKAKYNKDYEKPYDDAEEILGKLSQKYKIGVIANQSAGSEERLKTCGLYRYIDLCVTSAEIGLAKPDPMIFSYALVHARCNSSEAVMVGDRLDNDILPAKKLGLKTVRVLRGIAKDHEPPTEEYIADYTVEALDQLLDILK